MEPNPPCAGTTIRTRLRKKIGLKLKLATLKDGTRDGALIMVSRDLKHAVKADDIAFTLWAALDDWDCVSPQLTDRYEALTVGCSAAHPVCGTTRR